MRRKCRKDTVSGPKTPSPPLHLTDLSPETGHLVLQLPHPVRLGERGGEVVLRGDLLVLQHSLIKSLSARLGLCNEQVRDIKRYYWRENNKTDIRIFANTFLKSILFHIPDIM